MILVHRVLIDRICRPVAVLALALAGPLSAQTPPSSSATPLVAQIVSLQEKGDDAAAKRLVSRNARRLGVELTTVLEEIDRDFDDMSRQKARSDVLEKRFDQLESALVRYDKAFRLYRQVTGNQKPLRSFQAKALRIEGARRTTRGDMLWDRLEYAQALEEYSSAIAKLQEAIPLARLVEDQKLIGSCLNNIGYAAISKGNEAEGLRNYSEALKLAEHRQDDVYRGLYNLNMGVFLSIDRQASGIPPLFAGGQRIDAESGPKDMGGEHAAQSGLGPFGPGEHGGSSELSAESSREVDGGK